MIQRDEPSAAATSPSIEFADFTTQLAATGAPVHQIGGELAGDGRGVHTAHDLDTRGPQPRHALAGHTGVGVLDAHDHVCHAGFDERVDTGRCGAVVIARLERGVDRGPPGVGARRECRERHAFGVTRARTAGRGPRGQQRSVADDGTAHPRIRRGDAP